MSILILFLKLWVKGDVEARDFRAFYKSQKAIDFAWKATEQYHIKRTKYHTAQEWKYRL